MKRILLPFVTLIVFLISCSTETTSGSEVGYRSQTMKGDYYPAEKDSLARLIDRFADTTKMGTNGMSGYYLNYISMPHGRMEYIMQNAKDPLRAITGYDFETMIFITDCNSDEELETFDIYDGLGYASSFGNVKVDTEIRDALKKLYPDNCSVDFQNDQKYNRFEAYMNVIAKLVPDKKIVPIVIGKADKFQLSSFAQNVDDVIQKSKKNVLTVVITNLSENVGQDKARELDIPVIQSMEMGNTFTLLRSNLEHYNNELRALKTTTLIGQYGGANMFVPYLYNTSFNVFEDPAEYNSVKAYLASISAYDSQKSFVSFSPFKKMTLIKEFADTVNSAFKLGLNGNKSPNGMIVMSDFQKQYPFFLSVKKDGKLLGFKGEISPEYNILYTAHKIANDLALNTPQSKELLKDFKDIYLGMYICNFPRVIKNFPKDGSFSKIGFGMISEKGETYILPDIDFDQKSTAEEIKDILYKKAGIQETDKHILYKFDIFVLEKNAPEEQDKK